MPISRIARVGRVARAGQGGVTTPVTGHTILTITDDGGGEALVTTALAHGLSTNDPITISGTSLAFYNAAWNVTVTAPTTFTLQGAGFAGNSTGGAWA